MKSEEEAYAYAYNDGHSESRKNEPYKPNPTIKEGANFKKIYKQRAEYVSGAETFGAFSIDEDDEGKIHIENKCDGCGKEFFFTQNTNIIGGNRAGAIVYEKLDGITGHDYPEYSPHGDLLCKSCYKEGAEEDDFQRYNRGQGQYDAETFEADWTDLSRDSSGRWMKDTQVSGYDSLVKIALKNAGYGEIYENQVTHLEIDYTDIDPMYANKFYFVCITKNNNKMYVVGAYGSMSNRQGAKPNLSRIKLYNLLDNKPNGKTATSRIEHGKSYALRKIKEKLRKGYFAISDGIAGAQYRPEISDENLDAYIDIQPGQSGTFPLPVEKEEPSLNTTNDYITIRDLASMMNKMTGGMLGFAESRNTVLEMLGDNDSMERRDSLYFSIEDTIMTMENYNETGYEGDIQVMVDIMRDTGIAPPANFEEKVMARYQFEDKYAAEDKKILKPEVPADYNIQQTFGNNLILSSEDSGMTDLQIVSLIESPFWEAWTTSTTPVNPGWWNLTISVRDLKMWTRGIKANRNWKVSDVKSYFNIRGNKDSLVTQIEAIQRLINNLQEGDAGSLARVNDIIEVWFHHVPKEAESETFDAEEDEGPTIDDFFGELSKLLKKYGSIETFDSERVKEGLYFSGMILPHNGAYNFFQYDDDFGSGIIE